MKLKLKSLGIDWTAGLLNWISDHIIAPACARADRRGKLFTPTMRFGWWLEHQVSNLFAWFWNGSLEELFEAEDTPEQYWSARQLNFMRRKRARRGPVALIGYPRACH